MPISEGYGREGDRWYANSAQSLSKDKVDDWFQEEMDERGSVPVAFIETLVGSADLVGLWAIRSYIEAKGYCRSTVRTIMCELYPMPTARGVVPYLWKAELDTYLAGRQRGCAMGSYSGQTI